MIKAFDSAGNSSTSEATYINTKADTSAPSIPLGLKATSVTETEVALQWSPSSDNVKVKKYEVYCNGEIVGNPRKTSYVCKKLLPGESMNFTIKAVDSSGLRSAASTSLRVTTLKSVKGSSVSLSWNASKDNVKLKGYKLYCNGFEVATSTRTSRTVKNSLLGVGVYWVRAYDQSGNLSEKSNTVTVVTLK
jgi:chitodextrinase